MHIITVANQKGGCGKTTVSINLAASLAREARRTLLIDLDPQAHCALGMAVPEDQIDLSILECLLRRVDGEPLELSRVTWQIAPNLDLAPSKAELAGLEPKLGDCEDAETLLSGLLKESESRYDYCVIDCPPHLGLLMRNGLRAANEVMIPVDTGYFSLHGLTRQLATIEKLGERYGTRPAVRVLPNQYDVRTKLAREILAELRDRFKGVVYETIVNFNTKLKECASFGQPITEFAPTSTGARDFQKLAREVIAVEAPIVPTADLLEHMERLAADAERLLATTTTLVDNQPTVDRVSAEKPEAAKTIPARGIPVLPRAVEESLQRKSPTTSPILVERSTAATSVAAPVSSSPGLQPKVDAAIVGKNPTTPLVQSQTPPQGSPPATPETKSMERDVATQAAGPVETPPHPEEIDRKIAAVYGVRQEGEVIIFRSHNDEASEIQIAGDFNDWMPHTTPMRRLADGDFEIRLKLPKGRYRYRLVVDGRWSHDAHNPAIETNEYGELNSVVEVAK